MKAPASNTGSSGTTAGAVGRMSFPPMPTPSPSGLIPPKHAGGRPRKSARPPRQVTPARIDRIVALKLDGASRKEIAETLQLAPSSIHTTMARPDFQVRMDAMRETIRQATTERVLQTHDKTWAVFETSLDSGNTKDADNMARVLLNLEKIAGSTSGETRRIEHTGTIEVSGPPVIEQLQILLAQVVNQR